MVRGRWKYKGHFGVKSFELIVSKYVAESITMIAGRFGHEGLCQLHTKLKKLQCENYLTGG